MFLTPGELAFIAPAAVLAGSAMTGVIQSKVAARTLTHQRSLALDERRWAMRSDLYVDLVRAINKLVSALGMGNLDAVDDDDYLALIALDDRAELFASRTVRTALDETLSAVMELSRIVQERDPAADQAEFRARFEEAESKVRALSRTLVALMRAELAAD